jgi:hypothetical protein
MVVREGGEEQGRSGEISISMVGFFLACSTMLEVRSLSLALLVSIT